MEHVRRYHESTIALPIVAMSDNGRCCCGSQLIVASNNDSFVLTRFATEVDDDEAGQSRPRAIFCSFSLDEAVPVDHLVRKIAEVLDLSWVHSELAPFYPKIGRPSIDPELMIRMLIIGYVFAIRSERALCRDV